jgi:hypothetical protein
MTACYYSTGTAIIVPYESLGRNLNDNEMAAVYIYIAVTITTLIQHPN